MVKVTLWSLLVAAAVGFVYYWAAVEFWGIYAAGNPINDTLLDVLVRRGHNMAYRVIISVHDVILNVLLALPFAAVFRLLRAVRSWTHVGLAATVAVIVGYGPTEWESLPLLFRGWVFCFGFAMSALSLPLAFALLSRFHRGATRLSVDSNAA